MKNRIVSILLIAAVFICGIAGCFACAEDSWNCPSCGRTVTGKFCGKCGTQRPTTETWICPDCGAVISKEMQFCTECGNKMPGRDWYCAKCLHFNEGENAFCSECGSAEEKEEFFTMQWNGTINPFNNAGWKPDIKKNGGTFDIETWTYRENYVQFCHLRFPQYLNEGETFRITGGNPYAYFAVDVGGNFSLLIFGELGANGLSGKADYYSVTLTRKETQGYKTIFEGTVDAVFNKGSDNCFAAFRLIYSE